MAVPVKKSFSSLGMIRRWINARWHALTVPNQSGQHDERGLQKLMRDLNMTEAGLDRAVVRGAYPSVMLPEMVSAVGLPSDRLEARYFTRACEQCASPARCRRELDSGTAAANYREFCENAPTLEALLAEAARDAEPRKADTRA